MAAKKSEDKKPKGQINTLPDGSIIDLSTLPIGDIKLTDREARFVFWYTYPGTDAFQHQTRAAVAAGCKKESAYVRGCELRKKDNVASAIKKIVDSQFKVDLEEEFHKIIQLKKARVHYDIGDYYHKIEKPIGTDDEGNSITVTVEDLKDLADLTPVQRMAIDGIDYKGQQAAIRSYLMADRDKAMNDLIALYQKLNGPVNENEYDFEATAEIIKGQLAMKVTARKRKEELAKTADFMKASGPLIQEL